MGSLHDQSDLFELLLHTLDVIAEGLEARRCIACGVVGDAISAPREIDADEICGLPGIKARVQKLFAQTREICFGELLNLECLCFHHGPLLPVIAYSLDAQNSF